ncbi:hypothetical protein DSUL_30110 [Desulfovibrionales bacterium]
MTVLLLPTNQRRFAALVWFCILASFLFQTYPATTQAITPPPSKINPVNIRGLEILTSGSYGDLLDQTQWLPNNPCNGIPLRRLTSGPHITATIATRFGFEFLLHGEPAGAAALLTVNVRHPDIIDSTTGHRSNEESWELPACVGRPNYVGWGFTSKQELVAGPWTIELSWQGQILGNASFEVTLDKHMAELDLSYYLGPKIPLLTTTEYVHPLKAAAKLSIRKRLKPLPSFFYRATPSHYRAQQKLTAKRQR